MQVSVRLVVASLTLALVLILSPAGQAGAAVTVRLSTGRAATGTAEGLAQAWVAPADAPPTIDGKLDEAVWSKTCPIVLGKLRTRGKAEPRSEFRLLRTKTTLYVGALLEEPNIDELRREIRQTDGPVYRDDSIELFLAPVPADGYMQLIISASGAAFDRRGHGDPAAFNAGVETRVAIGKEGWSLEAAIPLSGLGVGQETPTRWRANFYRNRHAGTEGENQAWSPTLRPDYDVPERFGHLLLTPTCPWSEQELTAQEQRGIEIEELGAESAVLRFDLSSLPNSPRVYGARLTCKRRINVAELDRPPAVEIYPVRGPYEPGSTPRLERTPLETVPPWHRSFDATGVVRRWLRDGGGAVYVRELTGWRVETTCLDVTYEGEPDQVPPQVSDVKAFHRSGQTFLTWKEIEDPVGRDVVHWGDMQSLLGDLDRTREVRYCVYRFTKPITAEDLHEAEQIAVVPPLSCWNTNGRNIARPIDEFIAAEKVLRWHQWNPFRDASIDGSYGRDCRIDRFVITDDGRPLPRGTGLYVHTATANQQAYYAVVTRVDGIENTRDVGPANSLPRSISESVADPEPVLQRELPKGPFFNYAQRRLHYVRWVAEPYSNKPSDYFNWSVGVPDAIESGAALELNLHCDGYSYWRTHYRIEPGSIVLCPYDFPVKTYWYGYHEALGTLRPWSQGAIQNYTERRLLSFADWAAKKWPVDRNRILVTGCRGGASGSGALHLGLRYPEIFNMVIAGHGEPDYRVAADALAGIWGKPEWGLKTESGQSVWDELDLTGYVSSLPASAGLPFVSMTYSSQQTKTHALAEALIAGRHAVITHTAWGGQRMVPVSATATHWAIPLDVRKDQAMLAVAATGKAGDAVLGGSLVWSAADMVDQPGQFAVTLHQGRGDFTGSITLRRLQRFDAQPDKNYAWRLEPIGPADDRRRDAPQPQEGSLAAGRDGLLTLGDLRIPPGSHRLTIFPAQR